MRRGLPRMKLQLQSSPSLTPVQLPSKMETHLWYVKPSQVKSESLLKQYLDILSPCEKENLSQMRGEDLRKSSLLVRALVRTTIARYQVYSQVTPRSLKFLKNMHGIFSFSSNCAMYWQVEWPCISDENPPGLHFNISHTSSLVACGVTINSQATKEEVCEILKCNPRGFSSLIHGHSTCQYIVQASEITVNRDDGSSDLTNNCHFLLLELAGSHYAAICTENISTTEGGRIVPAKVKVWNSIPFLEDKCVSDTDAVKIIGGLKYLE